jgi:hypothetical protein
MKTPRIPENLVHSTQNTPMSGLLEFIETTTVTKRWIYRRFPAKHHPKKERSGKVTHTKFPRVDFPPFEGINKI